MENLVELKKEELENTDGGFLDMLAAAYLSVAIYAIMDDPQGVVDGFLDGFN